MAVYDQEIFGPVLVLTGADSLDETHRADQQQPQRQRHRHLHPELARWRLQVPGENIDVGRASMCRDSGAGAAVQFYRLARLQKLGDLGLYGKQVVMFYTQTKTITQRWFDDPASMGRWNNHHQPEVKPPSAAKSRLQKRAWRCCTTCRTTRTVRPAPGPLR